MDQRNKILMALTQIENLAKLVEENQWEGYFNHHLTHMNYRDTKDVAVSAFIDLGFTPFKEP